MPLKSALPKPKTHQSGITELLDELLLLLDELELLLELEELLLELEELLLDSFCKTIWPGFNIQSGGSPPKS